MMNKLQNISQRNFLVFVSSILVLVLLCSTCIAAYLTDGDRTKNNVTIGSNVIEITEEFVPPDVLEPGATFKKDVKITNTGTVECYVRVLAVFSDSDMGNYCTVDWHDQTFLQSSGHDINKGYWVYHSEDGYWYFTKPIAVEDCTPSLLTTVTLADNITYAEIKDFELIVYAESYQAHGFSNYTDAWVHYQANQPES